METLRIAERSLGFAGGAQVPVAIPQRLESILWATRALVLWRQTSKNSNKKHNIPHMRTMVLEYLPTKLGDFVWHMLVNIPAPWFASGYHLVINHG